jgi:hypothetical protein
MIRLEDILAKVEKAPILETDFDLFGVLIFSRPRSTKVSCGPPGEP